MIFMVVWVLEVKTAGCPGGDSPGKLWVLAVMSPSHAPAGGRGAGLILTAPWACLCHWAPKPAAAVRAWFTGALDTYWIANAKICSNASLSKIRLFL